ncbi:MAG: MFS transporter [Acidimicrobiales bacterium]
MVAPSNTPTSDAQPPPGAVPLRLLTWQAIFALAAAAIGGVTAVLPLLRDTHNLATTTVGVIAGAGFLAAFVGQGFLAPLAEHWPRRPLIVAGLGITVLGLLGMAIGENAWQFVLARVAIGCGTGVVVPTVRAVVAGSDPDRLAENQGRLVVGEMFGFVAGPAVTAVLAELFGLSVAFLVLAAALALFLPVAFGLPDIRPTISGLERESVRMLLRRRRLRGVVMMMGGYALGLGTFEAVLPLQVSDLGVSTAGIGLFVTVFVVPIAFSSVVGGRVADRLGAQPIAAVGMIAGSALFMLLGVAPGLISLGVILGLAGVADGFGFTAALAVASAAVPLDRQATALGVVGATEVLLAGMATIPAAWLFDRYGASVTWLVMGGIMTLVVSIGALVSTGQSGRTPAPLSTQLPRM